MLASKKSQFLLIVLVSLVVALTFSFGCSKKEKETKPKVTKPAKPLVAEIKVDKSKANPGEKLKYTVIIKNNTEKPFEGVKIKFLHPSGTTGEMAQEGGPQPNFDEQTRIWTWDVGTLQAKGSFWFSFTLDTLPDTPSGVTITAKFDVEASSLSKPVSSNTVTTTIQ